MWTGSQLRQNLALMLTGGALVAAGMALNSRHEALAIPQMSKVDDLSAVFRQVASDAMPSIVSIEAVTKAKQVQLPGQAMPTDQEAFLRQFFGNDPRLEELFRNRGARRMMTPERKGMGSGFVINSNGTILTNSHVVNGADQVTVHLSDGRVFTAKEIHTDKRTDVAIVKIDAPNLKPIHLGDSRQTEVGDWVLAIGSPFGLDLTVTAGIISAKGRDKATVGNEIQRAEFLQTDAAINPGNSGGPLINMRGEVIGINTAIKTESGGYDGIGFAIPTHIAGWVSQQLMTTGEVRRGYIGTTIQSIDVDLMEKWKLASREGALISDVTKGSPAEKAGIETGDIVIGLSGQKVENPSSLQGIVEQLTIGKSYPIEVIRGGKRKMLRITIDELPSDRQESARPESTEEPRGELFKKLGLDVQPLTDDLARQFEISADAGLVVAKTQSGSLAERSGIKPGDMIEKVNGQSVRTPVDVERAQGSRGPNENVTVLVRSPNGRRFQVTFRGN